MARKKRSLLSWAFGNQYNFILLGAAALFSIATFSWVPLVIGAGIETLWLTIGSDTSLFKRWVATQEGATERASIEKQSEAALKLLGPRYVGRFQELVELGDEIVKLAEDNPNIETSLIQEDLKKLGRLQYSFLQMAVVHQRLAEYLSDNSETDIQRDINQSERALASEKSREVQLSLRQAVDLGKKRMRQHSTIESNFKLVTVKMDTLEKSFRYLKSHIVAISKPEELTQEIDGLILGVESVEELSAESGSLLEGLRAQRAQAIKK